MATGLGLGYFPVAPGTVGSLAALPLVWALFRVGGSPLVLAGLVLVTAAGLAWAGVAARGFGKPDPGAIVVDEIAGQMLSLLFLVPTAGALGVGFLLFRLFDIWKPWPCRRLESLPGGSGIMADDLMAGIYANIAQWALRWAFPEFWGLA